MDKKIDVELTPLQRTVYIYVLRDPETLRVHYVGKTKCLADRIYSHMHVLPGELATPKGQWISRLIERSLEPEVCIVETGDIEQSGELERKWIRFFAEKDEPLFNSCFLPFHAAQEEEPIPELVTARQAAIRKGVADSAVRKAIKEGRLRGEKIGTVWLVRVEDIDAWEVKRGTLKGETRRKKETT